MVFTVRDDDGARIQGHRVISDWSMYGGKGTRKVQLMTEDYAQRYLNHTKQG